MALILRNLAEKSEFLKYIGILEGMGEINVDCRTPVLWTFYNCVVFYLTLHTLGGILYTRVVMLLVRRPLNGITSVIQVVELLQVTLFNLIILDGEKKYCFVND